VSRRGCGGASPANLFRRGPATLKPIVSLSVRAFAKINLALAVLGKREDGYHDIRTVFHTISVADRLEISFTRARRTRITVTADMAIPGANLAETAARRVLDAAQVNGEVRIHIVKHIPMGGGLGGGSTDAAATVRALVRLIGRPVDEHAIAAGLGSDVPFFLYGGCALGSGRGEELYPLPSPVGGAHGLLVTPSVHVPTPDAYRALNRTSGGLTTPEEFSILKRLQSLAWALDVRKPREVWARDCVNDFEEVVFRQYPVLRTLRRKLGQMGAAPALMTGSGAALFGFFPDAAAVQAAVERFGAGEARPFSLLSRNLFQARWKRWLSGLPDARNEIRPAKNSLG
jgi:4-diphosphocytidyl-2-C-methyl-D-erythritol kinase